jgi:tRNA nucleotidyltransferase/poly(A) polymerase
MIKLYELISSEVLLAESKLRLSVPSDIKKLYKLFKKNGKHLYVVGGAVRDAILGKSPKDFDLATNAKPDEVLDIAKQGGFKTVEVGKSFGVVIVNGHEIATFRKDIGKGRRPDSVDYTDIEGDVKRRDLTINALFYDIGRAEIVDLVGGIADLKKKKIRTVGDAAARFDEDPLRKLRAVRFAGSVGGKMTKDTWNALKENPDISGVSRERIRDEFIKGIRKAKSVHNYLKMVLKLGMFPQIFPSLRINKNFAKTNDYIVQIANMLQIENYRRVEKVLNSLKYQNQEVKDVVFLLKLNNFTPDQIYDIKKEQENTKLKDKQVKLWSSIVDSSIMKIWKFKLSVKGGDLAKQGFKGKEISDKMREMETNLFLGK